MPGHEASSALGRYSHKIQRNCSCTRYQAANADPIAEMISMIRTAMINRHPSVIASLFRFGLTGGKYHQIRKISTANTAEGS